MPIKLTIAASEDFENTHSGIPSSYYHEELHGLTLSQGPPIYNAVDKARGSALTVGHSP